MRSRSDPHVLLIDDATGNTITLHHHHLDHPFLRRVFNVVWKYVSYSAVIKALSAALMLRVRKTKRYHQPCGAVSPTSTAIFFQPQRTTMSQISQESQQSHIGEGLNARGSSFSAYLTNGLCPVRVFSGRWDFYCAHRVARGDEYGVRSKTNSFHTCSFLGICYCTFRAVRRAVQFSYPYT